jgi:hypothetical protein
MRVATSKSTSSLPLTARSRRPKVVQGSGLSELDAAAVAVFRNAHLPPFPPGTLVQPADVVATLHYRPVDSGG